MKSNQWQKRFGSARRATDKALCAELEQQIKRECDCCGEMKPDCENVVAMGMDTTACEDCRDYDPSASSRIARAFGRPV